jgi:hypothetical protein
MDRLKDGRKNLVNELNKIGFNINEWCFIPECLKKDKRITLNSKYLYSEFLKNDYITHEDIAISENIIPSLVNKKIQSLVEYNYIKELSQEEKMEILKTKDLKNKGIGNKECSVCNIKTFYLHPHHYPILKSKGGTDTIDICPTCHAEFHVKLYSIVITQELVQEIKRFVKNKLNASVKYVDGMVG